MRLRNVKICKKKAHVFRCSVILPKILSPVSWSWDCIKPAQLSCENLKVEISLKEFEKYLISLVMILINST